MSESGASSVPDTAFRTPEDVIAAGGSLPDGVGEAGSDNDDVTGGDDTHLVNQSDDIATPVEPPNLIECPTCSVTGGNPVCPTCAPGPLDQSSGEGGGEGSGGNDAPAEDPNWFYIDDDGKEQGPFAQSQLRTWWFGGFLPSQIKAKKEGDEDYVLLASRDEFKAMSATAASSASTPATPASGGGYAYDPATYYAYYGYYGYGAAAAPTAAATASTAATTATTAATPAQSTQTSEYLESFHSRFPLYGADVPKAAEGGPVPTAEHLAYVQHAMFNSTSGRFTAQGAKWGSSADRQMSHYFDVDAWQEQMQVSKRQRHEQPKGVDWRAYKKKKKLEKRRKQILAERMKDNELI